MYFPGKVFPKLKRKGSRLSNLSTSSKEGSTSSTSSTDIEEEATDYVFRIVKVFKPDNIRKYSQALRGERNTVITIYEIKSHFNCLPFSPLLAHSYLKSHSTRKYI